MNTLGLLAALGIGGLAVYLFNRQAQSVPLDVLPAPSKNYVPVGGVCVDTGQCGPNESYGPTAWTPAPDLCVRGPGGFCSGPINPLALALQRATQCACSPKFAALTSGGGPGAM